MSTITVKDGTTIYYSGSVQPIRPKGGSRVWRRFFRE
jgi:hypothetical protein